MDFRRAILSISLGLLLLLIWQAWVDYDARKKDEIAIVQERETELPDTPATSSTQTQQPGAEVPLTPSGSASAPDASRVVPESSALETGTRIRVETDLLKVDIDTFGGELREAKLLNYPVEVDLPDVPFRILTDISPGLLVAQSGLIGSDGDYPNHKTIFTTPAASYILQESDESVRVPLQWTSPSGVTYTKTYTFHQDSYLVDVEYQVDNRSAQPWLGYQYGQFLSTEMETESEGFLFFRALPSYRGAAVYTPEEKYEKIDYKEIRTDKPTLETASGWIAMLQHYFVTAWLPEEGSPYRFYTKSLAGNGETRYQVGYVTLTPTSVASGSVGTLRSRIYLGPKEQARIKTPAEGLILTVDYGWLTPVSSPLFWVLQRINDVVGNWGWSIILLTLLVKIVFYPLSAASYKSMAKMKKLQPRLKTLKERYGDDKQKLNQEMMEIYKKDKINPLGGCLPILIQIPVFIALYWVLLESVELRQAPFIFWLNDLSRSDPFYVLPVLMGASMFAQQLLNPTPLDTMQKNIMMSLPFVFTIFFLWFPAGLVLYWLVNNILSIAQQWYITRKLAAT